MSTAVPICFGLMSWGEEGTNGSRVHDLASCEQMLDAFVKHGHKEVDTAIAYSAGTSEKYLGQLDWKSRGILVDTKLYPYHDLGYYHTRDSIRKWFQVQLESVKAESFNMWYLHGPDRSIPYEETLEAVNELYTEGKFKYFGISNFAGWEVQEMVSICERRGWVKPSVYQGLYNAVHRAVEPELFPCLRKNKIAFYGFGPMAGGFLSGKYSRTSTAEKGTRYDPETVQGRWSRNRYWNEPYFNALDMLEPILQKNKLTFPETALRWMCHHSQLKKELGDKVLIGASSVANLEENLNDLEKGPLPDEVVAALDEAWTMVRGRATLYFHASAPK